MWQQITKAFVASGKLVVIGVVQEQHPDRARLYRQWRKLDWPIFVDSLNSQDIAVVPVPVAIDASGIVRHAQIHPRRFVKQFMAVDYPTVTIPAQDNRAQLPQPELLLSKAQSSSNADVWRKLGETYFLRGKAGDLNEAIKAFERAVQRDPHDGRAQFRLGVALRRRYESPDRQPGDAQAAVTRWGRALAIDPNQYIWRRRIQQYGPRLDKPYNFYFWVDQARREIRARGEEPVPLSVEPTGSEIASPVSAAAEHSRPSMVNRDPHGKITRDRKGYVGIDPVVAPSQVRPGQRVTVRVEFRINDKLQPWWNNESDGLSLWLSLPKGFVVGRGRLAYPDPPESESRELRAIECEIGISNDVQQKRYEIPAYALYYVCEKESDKCLYRRQDFTLGLNVSQDAPTLK